MAYAVAYPFGIVRIILTMLLVRKIFSIDVDLEVRNVETSATTTERTGSIWFPCSAGHAAHGGEKLEIMFPPKLRTDKYQKRWNALV
jgi:uncharacterized transporter YbjL